MKCDNLNVPTYLHWNEKETLLDKDFLYYHKLYRLKNSRSNPIEIPEKYANAVSCRWSKLIKRKHIVIPLENKDSNFQDYDYVFLQEIRNYKKTGILDNNQHQYSGKHVLTCELSHSPENCNFSHVEILIHHQVYSDNTNQPIFDQVYSYQEWLEKKAMLNREGGKFFKGLKKAFRLDMIKLISRPSDANTLWEDVKAYCKTVKLDERINPNFNLED